MLIRTRRPLLAGLAIAAIVAVVGPSGADMPPCTAVQNQVGNKVLLDDVRPLPGAELETFQNDLEGFLDFRFGQLALEEGLAFVRCPERFPRGESDFDRNDIDWLSRRRVLMEVWGNTRLGPEHGGERPRIATLSCALIPLYKFRDPGLALPMVYQSSHQVRSDAAPENLFFDQAEDLSAFALIGAGIRLLKLLKDYDRALPKLCEGQRLLTSQGQPAANTPKGKLLRYVRKLAAETIRDAKADTSYHGDLRIVPDSIATHPCGR